MKTLPLYPDPRQPFEHTQPRGVDHGCQLCPLHVKAKTVCMNAAGTPGGALFVGDHPGEYEDAVGEPLSGAAGRYLRDLIPQWWSGPVLLDNAVRCQVHDKLPTTTVDRCRPYLAQTVFEAEPQRIICLGGQAAQSLFGESIPVLSTRKGVGWLYNYGKPIPVFILMNPANGLRNRFLREWFEADLKHALTCDLTKIPQPLFDAKTGVVESVADARIADEEIREAGGFTYDTEHTGRVNDPYLELLSLATTAYDSNSPWVWPREATDDPGICKILCDLLTDPDVKVSGQFLKHDHQVIAQVFGTIVHGTDVDIRLQRKLLDSAASGKLAHMAYLVGMGGHKLEMEHALTKAAGTVAKIRTKYRAGQPTLPGLEDPILTEAARTNLPAKTYTYGLVPKQLLHRYNARDALVTERLRRLFDFKLKKEPSLQRIWTKVVLGTTGAVTQMERWGVPVNRESIILYKQYLKGEIAKVSTRLESYGANPNSPKQLGELLFKKLGLPILVRTATGEPSTAAPVLMALRGKHPLIEELLKHRTYTKLNGTYAEGLLEYVRADGRIHPSFDVAGTECLPAGELVLTNRGTIPIEEVRVGDLVISHLGKPRAVTATSEHPPDLIYEVTLNSGVCLRTTGNHGYRVGARWIQADALSLTDPVTAYARLEEWCDIAGWPPFEVSSWGRIRNRKTGTVLAQRAKDRYGHLVVTLARDAARVRGEDRKDFSVHQLVLQAFQPGSGWVRHLNGIAWDNSIGNLAWGTSKQNAADAREHGTLSHRVGHAQAKLSTEAAEEIRATTREEVGDADLAAKFGVSRKLIRDVRTGVSWQPEKHIKGKRLKFYSGRIVAIRLLPPEKSYGLTVEEDCSHITGGIVTHNTGRTSTSDPNLQNLPRGKDEISKISRNCFAAPPGRVLVHIDFKQLEIRVAAVLSQDQRMIEVIKTGRDFHQAVAEIIAPKFWGIPVDQVTKQHRDPTKTIVFAKLYGARDSTIAKRIGCTIDEATHLGATIFGEFKDLDAYAKECAKETQQTGYTWTWWDGERARRRSLYQVANTGRDEKDVASRITAENGALNTPVQGTASEFCVASLVEIMNWLVHGNIDAKLVLGIHDALLFDCAENVVDEVCRVAAQIMTSWPSAGVPLEVDVEVGPAFGSLVKYGGAT